MSTTVEKYQVHELYAELRSRLANDPLFGGATLEQMDAYMAELVHRFAAGQVFNYDGPLTVEEMEVFFYGGDLHVSGDLVLGNQSIVVVAGDLDRLAIDGDFHQIRHIQELLGGPPGGPARAYPRPLRRGPGCHPRRGGDVQGLRGPHGAHGPR